ncbi:hypothetical protein PG991_015635 [Apiospora marii]|uniref:Uncharacterized protein n=1 Tax=Apiospora marii TaxID=335849 RepID=A0ABR1R348_9PEZI
MSLFGASPPDARTKQPQSWADRMTRSTSDTLFDDGDALGATAISSGPPIPEGNSRVPMILDLLGCVEDPERY